MPAFFDTIPEYEVRDGQMFISMADFTLVMPLRIFEDGCRRAEIAIAKWRAEKRGEIVPFVRT